MKCWNCGKDLPEPPWGKIPFRAECDFCHAALHCCRNCVHYKPGLPNDCNVPNTEYVADRSASNLCEEFKLLGKGPPKASDPNQAAKKLFGDDSPEEKKDKWKDLWKDS